MSSSSPPSHGPPVLSSAYNIHDNPSVYFKEAIRELRCRLKLCEGYCLFFDDFANVEDLYGKIVAKVTHLYLPFA